MLSVVGESQFASCISFVPEHGQTRLIVGSGSDDRTLRCTHHHAASTRPHSTNHSPDHRRKTTYYPEYRRIGEMSRETGKVHPDCLFSQRQHEKASLARDGESEGSIAPVRTRVNREAFALSWIVVADGCQDESGFATAAKAGAGEGRSRRRALESGPEKLCSMWWAT